ncbi:hypothetical protein Prudu_017994 [Prunus dulcis]|uniref:Uncharacterized protein n=1 Tax=Prunus dulcis TaxID=3755 RepID=A0A4Y1RRA4_PRUDU|nr:hypothetical protein Prudu_017994 [Prunus dulcis]
MSCDIVPMSKTGLYHSMKTEWHDMIGRHCPIFAVNREVLIPIVKPMGYTGADAYKLSFQVGREKFLIPWLFVINRKSSEVPMIDVHLRYSGSDLHGVTAKVVDMPHHYVEIHPDIRKQFWDPQHWPKHVLAGAIRDRRDFRILCTVWIRFVRERVAESSMPAGGVAKVE